MDPVTTGPGFAVWLSRKDDPRVLRRLVEGYDLALMAGTQTAKPAVLKAVVERLHGTAEDRLRQALIRLLGGLVAKQPAAKQALAEAFVREWISAHEAAHRGVCRRRHALSRAMMFGLTEILLKAGLRPPGGPQRRRFRRPPSRQH